MVRTITACLACWLSGLYIGHCSATVAHADYDPAALELAQHCRVEADWRLDDCSAVFHVAKKRTPEGDDWLPALRAYSALDAATDRAIETRSWTWGDIPGASPRINRKWSALREHAALLIAGIIPDPCPPARHWGGRGDKPRGRMRAVCVDRGFANTFYEVSG